MKSSTLFAAALALGAGCGGSLLGPGDLTDELGRRSEPLAATSALFFHGLGRAGRAEAAPYAYSPDLYAESPRDPFHGSPAIWPDAAAVGGYSAGRLPAMAYLAARPGVVKYLFLLDPSWDDHADYGATTILPWLRGDPERQLLMIVGPASEGQILERYVGALRATPEWLRVVVCHTRDPHREMRRHIPAVADPGYRAGRCE